MDKKSNGGFKEMWRKFLVALKRKPQTIGLVALTLTYLYYALHLTTISNTTAKIQGSGMGLAGFCTMLFSILSFLCYMNAYPTRKPVNIKFFVLLLVMFGIIAFADYYYLQQIYASLTRPVNPIVVTQNTIYIAYAEYYLRMHLIFLVVTLVLILLLPVYSKMLRKIKTSVEVEDNGDIGEIDISAEA
jgi:hypothetical protein